MIEQDHIARYRELWVNREDIHALQLTSGAFILRRAPVTEELIEQHLNGRLTAGWYALAQDSTCRWLAIDLDSNDRSDLKKLRAAFEQHGIPSYVEDSRRCGHVWVFMDQPSSARAVRQLGKAIVQESGIGPVEIFPKQNSLSVDRVGSLVRGPLGRHQKSGEFYGFLHPLSLESIGSSEAQFEYLFSVKKLTPLQLMDAMAAVWEERQRTAERTMLLVSDDHRARSGLIERLKERVDLYEFVSQYVSLDQHGRGPCPLHPPDAHPSFMVNREQGYWLCFHEQQANGRYLGGDLIAFVQKLNGWTTREAVSELSKRYL